MIDKKAKRYIRTKYGDANFLYVEEFDSVEKAAEPLNKGKFVEVVIKEYKWDHTIVKEIIDGKDQKSTASSDGQTEKKK
tara:strand:+ start:2652 stop:2888 length:237 start_codon:yes stop_codon:yes gene_type:complete